MVVVVKIVMRVRKSVLLFPTIEDKVLDKVNVLDLLVALMRVLKDPGRFFEIFFIDTQW